MNDNHIVVAGGGGFIGGHLVARLLEQGFAVRSVDVKPLPDWYQVHQDADNLVADLQLADWSAFGVANRLLPDAIGGRLVERSMRRRGTNRPFFPAHYDRCTYSSLTRLTSEWSDVQIYPLFHGATYFHFSRLLTRAYLAYENAVRRAHLNDLATHYLLAARR